MRLLVLSLGDALNQSGNDGDGSRPLASRRGAQAKGLPTRLKDYDRRKTPRRLCGLVRAGDRNIGGRTRQDGRSGLSASLS